MFDLTFRLLVALGGIAGLTYWFAYSWREDGDWLRSGIKTATLAPLALFWGATSFAAGEPVWIMALGLGLGALGDFLLSRPGSGAFLAGLAAFGLGHLVYAAALFWRGAALGFHGLRASEVGGLAVLLAIVGSTEFWLIPRVGHLRRAVRAYVGLIALTALAALLLPDTPGAAELQMGAALFLVSDLLLALRLFVIRSNLLRGLLGAAVWPAYVQGQVLIFWGSLLFWTFPAVAP